METVASPKPATVPAPADFTRPENATGGQLYGPGGWQSRMELPPALSELILTQPRTQNE